MDWVCADIKIKFQSPNYCTQIQNDLKDTFGDELEDIYFLGHQLGETAFHNALESYFFLKCSNTKEFIKKLKKKKYISYVITEYDLGVVIPKQQIKDLNKSYMEKVKIPHYFFGEVVKVKEGDYYNLYGIVIGHIGDTVKVLFKFSRGYKIAELLEYNLCETNQNMFDYIKVPVT